MIDVLKAVDIFGATTSFQTGKNTTFKSPIGGIIVIAIVISYISTIN